MTEQLKTEPEYSNLHEQATEEIANVVLAEMQRIHGEHRHVLPGVSEPLLDAKDREMLQRLAARIYMRNTVMVPDETNAKHDTYTIPASTKANAKNSREVVFTGKTAFLVSEFAEGCSNRLLRVAFGIYMNKKLSGIDPEISFTEIAEAAGASESHVGRTLRSIGQSSFSFRRNVSHIQGDGLYNGWNIIIKSGGKCEFKKAGSIEHVTDSSFRDTIEAIDSHKRDAAKKVCAMLIQKYVEDGNELTTDEIIAATDIESHADVVELMQQLSQEFPSSTHTDIKELERKRVQNTEPATGVNMFVAGYCSTFRMKYRNTVILHGNEQEGWYISEPYEKTILNEVEIEESQRAHGAF